MRTLLISLAAASFAVAADPVVFYVSPGGNDAWSGKIADPARNKKDGPFATLERARDAIRALR